MKVTVEKQADTVTDAARARFAMVRPILLSTLLSLKKDRVERLQGLEKVTLADLAREHREGSGDCGICFEYAVHEAIRNNDPQIHPLVSTVLEDFCGIRAGASSILFGAEKSGGFFLIETAADLLTEESRILVGSKGQPPKLRRHIDQITQAFRSPAQREKLPPSIRGLWRADMFVGSPNEDRWVATSLKINPGDLEGDKGIRIGIYPERKKGESPSRDASKNLILCPLPYNAGFMELFYSSFFIVRQFLNADAEMPKPVALPSSDDRFVAAELVARRQFGVMEVTAALEPMAQPNLLESYNVGADASSGTTAIAPVAQKT